MSNDPMNVLIAILIADVGLLVCLIIIGVLSTPQMREHNAAANTPPCPACFSGR